MYSDSLKYRIIIVFPTHVITVSQSHVIITFQYHVMIMSQIYAIISPSCVITTSEKSNFM